MTFLHIKEIQVNVDKPKASKKIRHIIVAKCDICGVIFEYKYTKAGMINHKTDKQSCGAKMRELRMTTEKKANRNKKRSQNMTIRNAEFWSLFSASDRADFCQRISASTQAAMDEMPVDAKELMKQRISAGTKKMWDERHDEIIESWCQTMKKNGTHRPSKPERVVWGMLLGLFGVDDVVYQHPIDRWPVDFYIRSIDTYIQVDGSYWHPVSTELDCLMNSSKQRDRKRAATIIKDQKQNHWFNDQGLMLVRIPEHVISKLDLDMFRSMLFNKTSVSSIGGR